MNSEQDSSIQTLLIKIDKASQTQNWSGCNDYIQQLPIWGTKNSFAQIDSHFQKQILEFAITILINGDFQDKWDITKIFPRLGENTVEVLDSLLKNNSLNAETQWFIAKILGNFKTESAVNTLANLLENCSDSEIIAICAKSLSQIGQPAIKTLIALLAKPDFRLIATKSLAHIRLAAAIPTLIDLATDNNSKIRKLAIEALGSFHEERVFRVLVVALKDPESSIRREAVSALGFWSHLATELDLVIYLQPMLSDLNIEVCRQATISLSRIKNKSAIEALNQALKSSYTPPVLKFDLVKALAWSENSNALVFLQEAFWTETNSICQTIITALGRISTQELKSQAISILREFWNLSSSAKIDTEIRKTLATALGDLEATTARDILENLLKDKEKTVQLHAIASIKKLDLVDQSDKLKSPIK